MDRSTRALTEGDPRSAQSESGSPEEA